MAHDNNTFPVGTPELWEAFRSEVRARGFNFVLTYGGAIPLDEWTPYGLLGGVNDPNWTSSVSHGMVFTWIGENCVTDCDKPTSPFIGGVWEFADEHPDAIYQEQNANYLSSLGV